MAALTRGAILESKADRMSAVPERGRPGRFGHIHYLRTWLWSKADKMSTVRGDPVRAEPTTGMAFSQSFCILWRL
jgi:hypothetical protein